ncbi:LRR receptor-like kinase family protein [Medicago truncatula]|uniref:LRR receptor-like kinase family protein n=2 Tax=Medicago truncatula TaxID=3880 RepID=G7LIB5_MEDTR|nr:LRR receptor-like kinase family protein [Medicago truncatula]KEH19138.1 LRR receptor-like kinase family protein [Medicago truncatula]
MLPTWSNKEDCCKWRGVHCNMNGRVTNISLPCFTDDDEDITIGNMKTNKPHCLAGKIHLSLFDLEFLNYLDLSNNDFKSIHLPMDCQKLSSVNTSHGSGNFSNVFHLDLSQNENLVINDLRWLLRLSSSLQFLNLDSIDLHRETRWLQILTMFPSLSELHLYRCQLKSASQSLLYANFTSLEYLDLSQNDFFSDLPIWLFNISGLAYLNLQANRFHGQIPETLLKLQNLITLILMGNEMSGKIPDWIGQFTNLEYLELSMNLLIGSIPTTLGNVSSLTVFDVVLNNLTGSLPESLGKLSNLEVLYVGENNLSGVVTHRNFDKLFNLKELWFGSPLSIFNFDPQWIPPFKLQLLDLKCANLKLIPWLYTQTSLTTLKIENSTFKDVSQDKFWSLASHCLFLSLFHNNMPWNMSNVLLNSKVTWLIDNGLSGGLPQLTSNVSVFNLSFNNLTGPLSHLLCHNMIENTNLMFLDVSDNHLSGGLTECWGNWKSLIHVNLGNNNLTGMIPNSMGSLSNLMSFHISNTMLHGEIPVSLESCKKLVIVNFRNNKFSGNIPNWIGQDMEVLQLRSNEFSGDIPSQICQLSSLFVLDLSNNRLTGAIPQCLSNITSMTFNDVTQNEFYFSYNVFGVTFITTIPLLSKGNDLNYPKYMHVIDLSNNSLSGRIPLEIFRLTALQSLNLSQNQFMGTIPNEIGNMKQLESLDLSNNSLSGEIPQTMSALSFLEVLNLSFNNLKGQIPLGTQLQSFTPLSYMGNPELCGSPLIEKCNHDKVPDGDINVMAKEEEGSELMECFYMGMGVGFATGFWVVFGSLLFKRSWRHAYFNFLYDVKDWFMSK